MGTSSFGLGGDSIGSPTQPSYHQMETTAGADSVKSMLKIAQDTIDIPFFLLTQDVRKYQSSANRPVLAPLMAARSAASFETGSDKNVKIKYDELVSALPKDFQVLFQRQMLLGLSQRSENFQALDNALQNTAKILVSMQVAALPLSEDGLDANRAEANLAMPFIALGALIPQSQSLLSNAISLTQELGSKTPNLDQWTASLTEYNSIAADLKNAVFLLANPEKKQEAMDLLATTGQKIQQLTGDIERYARGKDLNFLLSTLKSASVVTDALTCKSPGASSLLLTLHIALLGAGDENSGLSLMGKNLSNTTSTLSSALSSAFIDKGSRGGKALLSHLVNLLFLGTAAMTGRISSSENETQEISPEKRHAENFSNSLTFFMLSESNILSSVANSISTASQANENTKSTLGQTLKFSQILSLTLSSLVGNDLSSATPLLKSQISGLKEALTDIAKFLSQEALNNPSNETVKKLNIYLQQANIALGNQDYEGFLKAFNNSLELSGSESRDVVKDIKTLKTDCKNIQNQAQGDPLNITEIGFAI